MINCANKEYVYGIYQSTSVQTFSLLESAIYNY